MQIAMRLLLQVCHMQHTHCVVCSHCCFVYIRLHMLASLCIVQQEHVCRWALSHSLVQLVYYVAKVVKVLDCNRCDCSPFEPGVLDVRYKRQDTACSTGCDIPVKHVKCLLHGPVALPLVLEVGLAQQNLKLRQRQL